MLPVNCTEHFFAALAAVFTVHLRKFYFGLVSKFCHAWKSLHVKKSLQEAYKENSLQCLIFDLITFQVFLNSDKLQ